MDAPFYPPTDTPSHSIVFVTTNLERLFKCRTRGEDEEDDDPTFVETRIDQAERVGRGPNPQELLALLGGNGDHALEAPGTCNKTISSDCTSLVDYVNR